MVEAGRQAVLYYKVVEIVVGLPSNRLIPYIALSLLIEGVGVSHRTLKTAPHLGREIRVQVVSDSPKRWRPSNMRNSLIFVSVEAHVSADDVVFGGSVMMLATLERSRFECFTEAWLFDATADLMIKLGVRNFLENGFSEFVLLDIISWCKCFRNREKVHIPRRNCCGVSITIVRNLSVDGVRDSFEGVFESFVPEDTGNMNWNSTLFDYVNAFTVLWLKKDVVWVEENMNEPGSYTLLETITPPTNEKGWWLHNRNEVLPLKVYMNVGIPVRSYSLTFNKRDVYYSGESCATSGLLLTR